MAISVKSLPEKHSKVQLPFVAALVGYSETGTTTFATGCQNPAAIGSCHSFTETVTVLAFSI